MGERRAASEASSAAHGCAAPTGEGSALAQRRRYVQQLFERYRRPLLRYLSGLLGRRADAEDVLQEAYARMLAVSELDDEPSRARAYLFKIATNLAYDRFRARKCMLDDAGEATELGDPHGTPDEIVDFEQGLEAVRSALLGLRPRCRQVFVLRAAEELSYEAIAARLGVSKRTVEREMKHALDVCQNRLRRSWK
jgi:RNA polymerase sigma factor (sigma-70 family)